MKANVLIRLRQLLALVLALGVSAALILSIPLLQYWLEHRHAQDELQKTAVSLKKVDLKTKTEEVKPRNTPKRMNSNQRTLKSGPRFGVDLGVMGAGGAALPADLVAKSGGGGAALGADNGDVDQRPELRGSLALDLPKSIRESQSNASLALKFCVDVSGRAYNIQVLEERPSGQGLSDAGRRAVEKAGFSPAQKDGRPVAFCGVEQEFQVNFND